MQSLHYTDFSKIILTDWHLFCRPLTRGDQYVIRAGQVVCRADYEKEFYLVQSFAAAAAAAAASSSTPASTAAAVAPDIGGSSSVTASESSQSTAEAKMQGNKVSALIFALFLNKSSSKRGKEKTNGRC